MDVEPTRIVETCGNPSKNQGLHSNRAFVATRIMLIKTDHIFGQMISDGWFSILKPEPKSSTFSEHTKDAHKFWNDPWIDLGQLGLELKSKKFPENV